MRIRFTNSELYVLCWLLDAELPAPLNEPGINADSNQWEAGVRSLVARCLLAPQEGERLELDAEYGQMMAEVLSARGVLSIVAYPQEFDALVSIVLVSDQRSFAVNPVVDGVWEFVETSLHQAAETACQIAQSVGPAAVGFQMDTAIENASPSQFQLTSVGDSFDFDGVAVQASEAPARFLELLRT